MTDEEAERLFDLLERHAKAEPVSEERLARIREGVLRRLFPPTPDRDAVREALASLLSVAPPMLVARLEDALGVRSSLTTQWQGEEAAKALLAAVSRPAEARGEPAAWLVVGLSGKRYVTRLNEDNAIAVSNDISEDGEPTMVRALYTHPAPVVSEANHPIVEAAALLARYGYSVTPPTPEQVAALAAREGA